MEVSAKENKNYKKTEANLKNVLVISHNSFNDINNMGQTLSRLFKYYPKKNISQLYFHSDPCDTNTCDKYYKITDKDILNSMFKFKKIKKGNNQNTKSITINKNIKTKKNYLTLLLKDILWKIGTWETNNLDEWIVDTRAEIIFLVPGYSKFIYDIAIKISQKYNLPIITYFCDNYYSEKIKSLNIFEIINKITLNKKIKNLMSITSDTIYISTSFKEKYENLFNKSGHVVFTPYNNKMLDSKIIGKNKKIAYIGNLSLKRWETLVKLGVEVDKINDENKEKNTIEVYTACTDKAIIKKLKKIKCIRFNGFIESKSIPRIVENADYLLHIESFDRKICCKTRYSISTKIPNYLMYNRLIIAIGPSDIESIKYLYNNNAAFIVNSISKMKIRLNELFNLTEKDYNKITNNAIMLAKRNHDIEKNGEKIKDVIKKIEGKR